MILFQDLHEFVFISHFCFHRESVHDRFILNDRASSSVVMIHLIYAYMIGYVLSSVSNFNVDIVGLYFTYIDLNISVPCKFFIIYSH